MEGMQMKKVLTGPQLDWQKIDKYCRILGMEEYSEKIRKFTE